VQAIDHYTRNIIQELAQRLDSIAAEKIKLVHENLCCLICYSCGGQRGWFVRKEVSVVGRRQLSFKVYSNGKQGE